jgi:hypothetical protein
MQISSIHLPKNIRNLSRLFFEPAIGWGCVSVVPFESCHAQKKESTERSAAAPSAVEVEPILSPSYHDVETPQ